MFTAKPHARCGRPRRAGLLAAALSACVLAGCAQPGAPGTPAAAPGAAGTATPEGAPGPLYSLFHRAVKTPEGAVEVLRLHGEGAQIFRCEAQAAGPRWVYRLPEAELRDATGKVLVRHGANLTFEHIDGSRLVGEIVDHVPSPNDGALPWLLMNARAYGKGALVPVTHIQRIDTVGGMPPASCEGAKPNAVLRVPFAADFVFLRQEPGSGGGK